MRIQVQSFATFRPYTAHLEDGTLEVGEGTTIAGVFDLLHVPAGVPKIILVNGRQKPPDYRLQSGDLLVFFPPLEGG